MYNGVITKITSDRDVTPSSVHTEGMLDCTFRYDDNNKVIMLLTVLTILVGSVGSQAFPSPPTVPKIKHARKKEEKVAAYTFISFNFLLPPFIAFVYYV